MTAVRVIVPYSLPRELWPNEKRHWGTKARVVKQVRRDVAMVAREAAAMARAGAGTHYTDAQMHAELARIERELRAQGLPLRVNRDEALDATAARRCNMLYPREDGEPGECEVCGSAYRWPVRREGGRRYCSVGCADGVEQGRRVA